MLSVIRGFTSDEVISTLHFCGARNQITTLSISHNSGSMDFPRDVDCVIYGSGLTESILSASLSVLGKRVLHIDRHDYYGGRLASFRLHDLHNLLQSADDPHSSSASFCEGSGGVLNLSPSISSPLCHRSSQWFVDDSPNNTFNGTTTNDLTAPDATEPIVLVETSNIPETTPETDVSPDLIDDADELPTVISNVPPSPTPAPYKWTRAALAERIRRFDIDLIPKVIHSSSPTVTTLLRSDVTRYLEFRPVSRCLAYTVIPDVENAEPSRQNQPSIIKVPVGRSELFKTRLLTLRQKRSLGAFFEWCFHLTLDDSGQLSQDKDNYAAYADRPLHEWLRDQNRLDDFCQSLVIVSLAFGHEDISTKVAIQRIRKLLLSMNRFGPYPLLWPLYGSGDFPQSFCRMSAVFGTIFCLQCSITTIRQFGAQLGDTNGTQTFRASDDLSTGHQSSRFVLQLSNGESVQTGCILMGAECLPWSCVQSQVHRWIARAILITDRTLCNDQSLKPTDVSILALPLSGRGNVQLDPALLLEVPVDRSRRTDEELFLVHLSAPMVTSTDPKQLFQPVIERHFCIPSNAEGEDDQTIKTRPHILWAGYYDLPDLSTVDCSIPPTMINNLSQFSAQNGLFICPGPDSTYHFDETMIATEALFNRIAIHLGLRDGVGPMSTGGGSDGPSISTFTISNGSTTETVVNEASPSTSSSAYISLHARWDGLFPPRPPRPEEIVTVDD